MGVPKFYRWISERYPCLSEVVKENQIPEFDNLYLDMNGIIHACTHPNDDDPDFHLEEHEMFNDITEYISALFRIIRPKRTFFMAVDGVAPRAKMNQQRARRFTSAKNAEKLSEKAEVPGKKRFDSNVITPGTSFMVRLHEHLKYFVHAKLTGDPTWRAVRVILSGHDCPGEGEHKIMDFIRAERSVPGYDTETRHCMYGLDADLIMLGLCSHEPHFSLLREEVRFGRPRKKERGHKPNVDEITFHLLHLSLLRDYLEHEFQELKTSSFPFDLESVIDDWVLMGFLVGNDFIPNLPHMHIAQNALPIMYKAYKNVAAYMGGYINEKGYLNLKRFGLFLEELAKYDKKNFENCAEDLEWLESKKQTAAANEKALAEMTFDSDEDDFAGDESELELARPTVSDNADASPTEPGAFDTSSSSSDDDEERDDREKTARAAGQAGIKSASELLGGRGIVDLDSQMEEDDENNEENEEVDGDDMLAEPQWTRETKRMFKRHKRAYYREKMEFANITADQLREQSTGYVRAIQWNLHYYYHGCASWSWHYRFHYAPYLSDVRDFADIDLSFDLCEPFKPFEQLLAVLPPASRHALPQAYHKLMVSEESPIIDFYPTEFACDLNGKQQEWEAVVLIPFIEEDRLLRAMRSVEHELTPEERARNVHNGHLQYTARRPAKGDLRPVASHDPVHFPDIENTLAEVTELPKSAHWLARDEIVHGLLSKWVNDNHVYMPGFPTLNHVPHTAYLSIAGVRVFQAASRNESTMLEITAGDDAARWRNGTAPAAAAINLFDLDEFAASVSDRLVGGTVHVDWPFLRRAQVVGVATKQFCVEVPDSYLLSQTADGDSTERTLRSAAVRRRVPAGAEQGQWQRAVDDYGDRLRERYGIVLPKVDVLVWVRHLLGTRISVDKNGKLTRVNQWSDGRSAVAYDLVVTSVRESRAGPSDECASVDRLFPVGEQVFVTGHSDASHYGCFGEVIKPWNAESRRFEVRVVEQDDPFIDDILARKKYIALQWYPAYRMGRELCLSATILSRITGSVLVNETKNEAEDDSKQKNKRGERDRNKINIGLKLKSIKRNEECPDYTRRDSDGQWLYSSKVYDLIQDYYEHFPEVFDHMCSVDARSDVYDCADLFAGADDPGGRLKALKEYLSKIPTAGLKRQTSGADIVDELMIGEIEKRVGKSLQEAKRGKQKTARLGVIASALYKPSLCAGHARPEPSADFQLFDRVVNVRPGHSVPMGLRGFVVGLHPGADEADLMLDVLFDEPFLGGRAIRSKAKSGFKLPASALLNRSWCARSSSNGDARKGSGASMAAGRSKDAKAPGLAGISFQKSPLDLGMSALATEFKQQQQSSHAGGSQQPMGWNGKQSDLGQQNKRTQPTSAAARAAPGAGGGVGTMVFSKSSASPVDDSYGRPPAMVVLSRQQPPAPPRGFGERWAPDTDAATAAYAALKAGPEQERRPQPPGFMPSFDNKPTPEDESAAYLKSMLRISDEGGGARMGQQQAGAFAAGVAAQSASPPRIDEQTASAYHYGVDWNGRLSQLCAKHGLPSGALVDERQLYDGRYIATISVNGYKFKSRAKHSSDEAAQSAAREAFEALRSMSPDQIAELRRPCAESGRRPYHWRDRDQQQFDSANGRPELPPQQHYGFEHNAAPSFYTAFGQAPPAAMVGPFPMAVGPRYSRPPPGAFGHPPPPLPFGPVGGPFAFGSPARQAPPGAFVPLQALRQQVAHASAGAPVPPAQNSSQPPVEAADDRTQVAAQSSPTKSTPTGVSAASSVAGEPAGGESSRAVGAHRRKRQSRLALDLSAK